MAHSLLRSFLCAALIFAPFHVLLAQNMRVGDSLLHANAPDSLRLAQTNEWLRTNLPSGPSEAFPLAEEVLQLALKTSNPRLIAGAYYNLGTALHFLEKIDIAKLNFEKSLTYATQANDPNAMIRANRGLIRYTMATGDMVLTISHLKSIEGLLPQVKEPALLAGYHTLCCGIYATLQRWDEVERIARRALDIAGVNNLTIPLPSAHYHLGKSFQHRGQLDSAIHYIRLAQQGYRNINNQEEVAGMTMQIAEILAKQNKKNEAIIEMAEALRIVETSHDSAGIGFVNMSFGKMRLGFGEIAEAERLLLRSKGIFEQLRQVPEQMVLYEILAELYEKKGQNGTALSYFKRFADLRENIAGVETKKKIAELEARFESTQKELRITNLNSENGYQRLQIGLLLALLALLGLAAAIGYQLVRGRQRKALLQQQQVWAQQVVDSTEGERRRIAFELHDGVAQQLAGIKLMAAGLLRQLPDTDKAKGKALITEIEQTGQDVRQLSHQMMPRSLGELGLSAALEDLFWLNFSQLGDTLTTETTQYQLQPHPTRDIALYRIAQEAVQNIQKHAEASAVALLLHANTHEIELCITDNGKGGAVDTATSLGMESMASRTRLLGGKLGIESAPEKGTLIRVLIPLLP